MPVARRIRQVTAPTDGANKLTASVIDHAERVYALYDGTFLKLGRTTHQHPHVRMADLQTGTPYELHLAAWTVTTTEAEMHRKFRRERKRGEWFEISERLVEELRTWTWIDEAVLDEVALWARLNTTRTERKDDQ